jgi:hypothetical protein
MHIRDRISLCTKYTSWIDRIVVIFMNNNAGKLVRMHLLCAVFVTAV